MPNVYAMVGGVSEFIEARDDVKCRCGMPDL